MPRSGLTSAAVLRLLLLRAVTPFSSLTLVVTQTHLQDRKKWAWAVLRKCATTTLVASEAQRRSLARQGVRTRLLGVRVNKGKISSVDPDVAKATIGATHGPTYLHVGHARHGRGLKLLSPIAPPGELIIVLSSAFPEEEGSVPDEPAIRVHRGHTERLGDYYRAADVYVFPTTSADSVIGVPMSIIESIANGTPVVAMRSDLTKRFENVEGVHLCDSPEQLADVARELGREPRRVADGKLFAAIEHCAGDFDVCTSKWSEMKLVAVSGVDGSGKSTFIREVADMLASQDPPRRVTTAWLRFNPRASYGSSASSAVVSTLDRSHRGHPAKRLARTIRLGRLWLELTSKLYERQLRWQLSALSAHDIVLADRFVLDYVADSVGSGLLDEQQVTRISRRLPAPDAQFVLTASDETLEERRHERESYEGLVSRRDLYLRIAEAERAQVVDTLRPDWQADVLEELRRRAVL